MKDLSGPVSGPGGTGIKSSAPLFAVETRRETVTFGRSEPAPTAATDTSRLAQAIRPEPVYRTALQRRQLGEIHRELRMLFADPVLPDAALPFEVDEDRREIAIGRMARIRFDTTAGSFVFIDEAAVPPATTTTRHPDRIVAAVLDHLSRGGMTTPVDPRVSPAERIADFSERSHILTTLWRCCGNRARTARLLGISPRALREAISLCWRDIGAEVDVGASHGGDQPTRQDLQPDIPECVSSEEVADSVVVHAFPGKGRR